MSEGYRNVENYFTAMTQRIRNVRKEIATFAHYLATLAVNFFTATAQSISQCAQNNSDLSAKLCDPSG